MASRPFITYYSGYAYPGHSSTAQKAAAAALRRVALGIHKRAIIVDTRTKKTVAEVECFGPNIVMVAFSRSSK